VGFDGEERGVFESQRSFIQASGIGVAIPGLLQAIPGTQLSRRLQKEGRLRSEAVVSLISTVEGINFVPRGEMTKREYLERYRRLVKEVFAPEPYFERILPAVLALRQIPRRTITRLLRRHLPVFLRMAYHLGFRIQGARHLFWKTLLLVLWRNPDALEAFGHDCFYYYHLNRHVDYVDRQLAAYLSSSPARRDGLDEVIPNTESTASAVWVPVAPGPRTGKATPTMAATA
jgi:hypothetical protein